MRKSKMIVRKSLTLFFAVAILASISGCGAHAQDADIAEATESTEYAEGNTPISNASGFGDISRNPSSETNTVVVSGLLAEMSYEDLLSRAEVIAIGTFTGETNVLEIAPVGGGDSSIFTDYAVEINSVIRGDCTAGDELDVRIQGGEIGNYRVVATEEPDVQAGDTALLFLYQPDGGGFYNTEGDYYYIVGVSQGIFSVEENLADVAVISVEASEMTVTENLSQSAVELVQNLGTAAKAVQQIAVDAQYVAFDPDWVYSGAENSVEHNMEAGFLTQEEYEESLKEEQQYATIIE